MTNEVYAKARRIIDGLRHDATDMLERLEKLELELIMALAQTAEHTAGEPNVDLEAMRLRCQQALAQTAEHTEKQRKQRRKGKNNDSSHNQ